MFSASSPHEKEVTAQKCCREMELLQSPEQTAVSCGSAMPVMRITALFVIKSHQSGTFCGAVAFAGCSEAAECHRQYFPCAENLPKSRGL